MSKINIFQALQKVKDNRQMGGKRHNLAVILLINIMATMSGYFGIRSKQDFINRNKRGLTQIFDPYLLKHGLPSKNTIDRAMQVVDYDDLNTVLSEVFEIQKGVGIHLDGKAIRATVTTKREQPAKQTFTSIVTAFTEGKSIVARSFVNGSKRSETGVVQELVKTLKLEGMVLTLDALHCQKKQ